MENFTEHNENTYVSPVFNNSEFDYQFVIEKVDLMDACGENGTMLSFNVAKTPKFIPQEKLNDIAETFCMEIEEITAIEVCEYGVRALLDSEICQTEKEVSEFIEKMDKQIPMINSMFGFYMDKYQNRIGNTGWDFLDGKIG